jgi:hypothetical protein
LEAGPESDRAGSNVKLKILRAVSLAREKLSQKSAAGMAGNSVKVGTSAASLSLQEY